MAFERMCEIMFSIYAGFHPVLFDWRQVENLLATFLLKRPDKAIGNWARAVLNGMLPEHHAPRKK